MNIFVWKWSKIAAQKKVFFLLILPWSTLLWHRCYYSHRSRDALSPVFGIFSPRNLFIQTFFFNEKLVSNFFSFFIIHWVHTVRFLLYTALHTLYYVRSVQSKQDKCPPHPRLRGEQFTEIPRYSKSMLMYNLLEWSTALFITIQCSLVLSNA